MSFQKVTFLICTVSLSLLFANQNDTTQLDDFDSVNVISSETPSNVIIIDEATNAELSEVIEIDRSFEEALQQNVDKEMVAAQ